MNERHPEMNNTALSYKELTAQWNAIDWPRVENSVNNLQGRIARAAKEENWSDVSRLTRLLTRSYYARLLAVRQVTTNKGKATPGIDNTVWMTPAEKMQGALNLTIRGYRAEPLVRTFIPKKNGKLRPLSIPTIRDRSMQALFNMALAPIEYVTGDRSSFGFRKGRSQHDACNQIRICLSRRCSAPWVLEADIRACFDMISHDWLLQNIPMKKSILKQFLKAGFMEGSQLLPTDSGTPQGGVLSPTLANMVLNGLERVLGMTFYSTKSGTITKAKNRHKVNLIRYADDMIITADTKETAENIKQMLIEFLEKRGLELSEEKTLITHISDGFSFLGWTFRKFGDKFKAQPSKGSVQSIVDKVHKIFRKGRSWTQDGIIREINPILRGWSNYHSIVSVSRTFSKIDNTIFNMCYAWAKRRHPKESRTKVVRKYWYQIGPRKWVFSTESQELFSLSKVKCRTYCMVQLDKNPYIDIDYFEKRSQKTTPRRRLSRNFSSLPVTHVG